jgi:hypothetical protein
VLTLEQVPALEQALALALVQVPALEQVRE